VWQSPGSTGVMELAMQPAVPLAEIGKKRSNVDQFCFCYFDIGWGLRLAALIKCVFIYVVIRSIYMMCILQDSQLSATQTV